MTFIKGQKGYWTGKKRDTKTKEKIGVKLTGRKLSKRTKEKMSEVGKRNETGKRFPDNSGENNPNWKGGISRDKHSWNKRYKNWRSKVFERDNWTCQTCGVRSLEPHHIKGWAKYPKLRYKISNGITLCRECHKLTDNYKNKKQNA